MYRILSLAILFAAASSQAQTPGSCDLGEARAELSLSDVSAALYNKGNLFWNGGNAEYEVPRGSGLAPLFAAGLWTGGLVGGEIRAAASDYAQGGADREFWPGPLDPGATLPDAGDCSVYDRIYHITAPELAAYNAGHPATPALAEWPVGLGAPAVDASGVSVVPTSREQTVDLEAGERPVVYGTETAFWVTNDVGGEHLSTGSAPLGIEVRTTAFSINDPDVPVFDQSTFYRFEVVNRNTVAIESFRLGLWSDLTFGDRDNYVGSEAGRSMFYVYNSDNDNGPPPGYGTEPPALGIDVLSGAHGALSYVGSGPNIDEPFVADDYYEYLSSIWKDGTPMTRLGYGYNPGSGSEAVTWHFDGDPTASNKFWSEFDDSPASGQQPRSAGPRRGVVSGTPVDLAPGASHTVDVAIVFAQGSSALDSVTELLAASDLVQSRYDDGSLFETVQPVADEAAPTAAALALSVAPNPSRGDARVSFTLPTAGAVRVRVVDVLGREVARLADGEHAAGPHAASMPARLAAGVYVITVEAGTERAARTLTVVR